MNVNKYTDDVDNINIAKNPLMEKIYLIVFS